MILFDTGQDRAVMTDPEYWPDRITRLFMRHIFRFDLGPEDTLTRQLELAGYSPRDVLKAVISHLHTDHVGGIREIPQAELVVSAEAWEHMLGPHPEREMVLRRDIDVPGARWHQITSTPTDDPSLAPFTHAHDLMEDRFPGTGDKEQLRESFAKVRGLKERMPELLIVPSHDAGAADALRGIPQSTSAGC